MSDYHQKETRLIAFYLPQFHPTLENNQWWGEGFTEWTNTVQARPLFNGHYQPHLPADLGFCDLRAPEVRQAQVDLALQYGISGFCYYHYWFNGKRLLEYPFQSVFTSGKPDFPFCLCWANEDWTRRWDGGWLTKDNDVLQRQQYSREDDLNHIRSLIPAFKDPRYIKVNGKPLFIVYRINQLPEPLETTRIWREEAHKNGFSGLYLCRVEAWGDERGDPATLGFDGAVGFQPDSANLGPRLRPNHYIAKISQYHRTLRENKVYDYKTLVTVALNRGFPNYAYFPGVTTGWDNSPRRKGGGARIFIGSTPEIYEEWLTRLLDLYEPRTGQENFIFINAWNEWAEGCHLEPCQKWGRAYLDATRNALNRSRDHR